MNFKLNIFACSACILIVSMLFQSCHDANAEESQQAESKIVIESCTSWNGDTLVNYPIGTPKITVLKITVPMGAKLAMHKHPIINVGYLLKGELTVVSIDGEKNTITAGDGIVELVGKYHYGENTGKEVVEIVVFYAGDTTSPLTVPYEEE